MKILRSAILVASVAASLATTVMPASAAGAGAFIGTAHINCFGCGTSPGTASLTVEGASTAAPGTAIVSTTPNVTATYTAVEDNDPTTCVISGTATGSTTGAVTVSFNWTRVGAAAVITTSGDINGAGAAVFVVTSPAGIPCRSAVDAVVVGALAGA